MLDTLVKDLWMRCAKKAPSLLLIPLDMLSRELHMLEQVFAHPLCFGFPSNDPEKRSVPLPRKKIVGFLY